MSTCNRLDLQTLGSQPIMPKNLPDHCSGYQYWCLPQILNYPFLLLTTMPKALPSNPTTLVVLCDQHEFGRSGYLSTLIKPLYGRRY